MTEDIGLDDISHFLLKNKYHLTALELDFELIERGTENKTLRNFFTNPMNFECVSSHNESSNVKLRSSPSVSTIDSIDFAKFSDDGQQQYDERNKVLEFELRKKTDEVRKLREELTQMSVSTVHTSFILDRWTSGVGDNFEQSGSLLAHENRTLNFLINEYLLQHRLKLTAVSFSEEVIDQDLDSWDDVGLNIPKLPSLEYLLKTKLSTLEEFSMKSVDKVDECYEESGVQTDPMDNDLLEHYTSLSEKLRETVTSLEKECEALNQARSQDAAEVKLQAQLVIQQKREINETKSKLICAQRDLVQESLKKKVSIQAPNSVSGDTDIRSETVSEISNVLDDVTNIDRVKLSSQTDDNGDDFADCKCDQQESGFSETVPLRSVTKEFVRLLQLTGNEDDNETAVSVPLVASLDEFVHLTSEALPRLFAGDASKDDPDLMMLLVQSTCLHPDTKQREKLLKFLINLYPEPNVHQRQLVLKQIEILAGYLGAFRVEAELITQIWEMLYEKPRLNSCKRILLANICGVVCPLAPTNLRSSLILSIHQQMLEEENDQKVIPHILLSIASTVSYLEDVDKIPVLVQLTLKYLLRSSQSIDQQKTESLNEPSSLDVVRDKLLPAVAQWCLDAGVIHTCLLHELMASMAEQAVIVPGCEYQSINRHLNIVHLILPFLDVWIKSSTPNQSENTNEDPESEVCTSLLPSAECNLYQCGIIVTPTKYCQMRSMFERYTNMHMPQSFLDTPTGRCSDNESTVSCWSPWPQLRWLQTEFVNKLVLILQDITPKCHNIDLASHRVISELAKGQFTYVSIRSRETCTKVARILFETCRYLSSAVVHDVVMPCLTRLIFESSDKGVDCDIRTATVVTGLVSGYCSALAALSLLTPSPASLDPLRRFLTNIFFLVSAEQLSSDGVKHAVSALCCCLGPLAVVDVILPAMQPCVACSESSVQMLMCIVVLELVAQIADRPPTGDSLFQAIIDLIRQLMASRHEAVRVLTVGPLVSVLQTAAISDSIKSQVFACLTDLMNESVNISPELPDSVGTSSSDPCSEVIITALIQMINIVGSMSPDSFRDNAILPWLLGITEINNSTQDSSRRAAIAMLLYSTFSTLSYYLESSNVLETCLLPSLDRLRLDMLEIYPENVKEVESMSQDIRKRLDSRHRHSAADGLSAVKGKISGLHFMTRNATVSSATSSLFGKIREIKEASNSTKSDDQLSTSSSSSTNKSNISNFFSKRK